MKMRHAGRTSHNRQVKRISSSRPQPVPLFFSSSTAVAKPASGAHEFRECLRYGEVGTPLGIIFVGRRSFGLSILFHHVTGFLPVPGEEAFSLLTSPSSIN